MKTKKIQSLLGIVFLLGGIVVFSGCGKKVNNNLPNLNQEKIKDSASQPNPMEKALAPEATPLNETMQTPDPGNSAGGKAIKEVDALLGTVSSSDYSAETLDENDLLSE